MKLRSDLDEEVAKEIQNQLDEELAQRLAA
jgi:hypothetical protein